MDTPGAQCPVHAVAATGTCERCGTFLCAECGAGICPACRQRTNAEVPYFAVSSLKLALMQIGSLGLYTIYWFYQQWKREVARTKENLSPFWRTVFYGICCFNLFNRILQNARSRALPVSFSPNLLGAIVLLSGFLARKDELWPLAHLGGSLALLPVQQAINAINAYDAPNADPNRRFTGWNIAMVTVGMLLFAMAVVGIFIGDEPAAM